MSIEEYFRRSREYAASRDIIRRFRRRRRVDNAKVISRSEE